MKKKDELLQNQNDRFLQFQQLVRSYVDLENRLKALDEKADKESCQLNDSENNQNFY